MKVCTKCHGNPSRNCLSSTETLSPSMFSSGQTAPQRYVVSIIGSHQVQSGSASVITASFSPPLPEPQGHPSPRCTGQCSRSAVPPRATMGRLLPEVAGMIWSQNDEAEVDIFTNINALSSLVLPKRTGLLGLSSCLVNPEA